MKASRITKPGVVDLIDLSERELLSPSAGWVTIEVAASGICGTDLHIYKGEYLGDYPIIPGHEFSGTIVAVGAEVDAWSEGDRVAVEPNISCGVCDECRENRQHFCRNWWAIGVTAPGGMATHVSVPASAAYSIGDLPFEAGAFMEPLSCVVHGVEIAAPRLGDRIAIAGAGPIGMLLVRTLAAGGATSIDVIERNGGRADAARADHASGVFHDLSEVPRAAYDIVVDATGSPRVVEQLVDLVRPAGKLLMFGVPPKGSKLEIDPFLVFNRELTIAGSFTSLRNSRQAVDLMAGGAVAVTDLVSHTLPLAEFARGVELLLEQREPAMKVLIDPRL